MELNQLVPKEISVVIVGDLILDSYLYGSVNRISPEAPVPVLHVQREAYVAGGAANVALNVSSLGGRCRLVGVIGRDAAADRLVGILEEAGVENRAVTCDTRPTTIKTRIMASRQQQLLRTDRETVAPIEPDLEDQLIHAVSQALDGAKALILSDYNKGCLTDRVLGACISLARERDLPVLIDPKRTDFSAYCGATYVKPNLKELQLASGMDCSNDELAGIAARKMAAEHGVSILLTRSERGICLYSVDGTEEESLPTQARDVFDVSGAGDTVIATFSLAIAAGTSARLAMRLANTAAGIVVGKAGTATVSREELRDLLAERSPRPPLRNDAVLTRDQARDMVAEWKRHGLTVGFTNGCFDLVHPGHIAILTGSAAACDRLVIGLNSDASVQRLKGPTRPIQSQEARATVIAAIGCVDAVVIFDEDTPLELITALSPDVLVKGADYEEHQIVGGEIVKASGGKVVRIPLEPGQSTTGLVKKIGTQEVT